MMALARVGQGTRSSPSFIASRTVAPMQSRSIANVMIALPRGWIVLGLAVAGWMAAAVLWRSSQILVLSLVG